MPGGKVAGAEIDHLAVANEILQRAQRLVQISMRVPAVQEQHVQPVGPQAPQTILDRAQDVAAVAAARVDVGFGSDRQEALGGDDQPVALAGDQSAQDLLRAAAAIGVGAVEEVDAGLTASRIDAAGFGLIGVAAEGHRPEAELRDLDARASEPNHSHHAGPPSLPKGYAIGGTSASTRPVPRTQALARPFRLSLAIWKML